MSELPLKVATVKQVRSRQGENRDVCFESCPTAAAATTEKSQIKDIFPSWTESSREKKWQSKAQRGKVQLLYILPINKEVEEIP